MSAKFQKKKENFNCQICGQTVVGNGYTNHCPFCLFSRHVDINPGDRKEKCQGTMKPIGIIKKKGRDKIVFSCQKCGLVRLNRPAKTDSPAALAGLYSKAVNLGKK